MNIFAVVLAGGDSRRFGSDKLAAALGQQTLLDHTLAALPEAFTLVVVGPERATARPVTFTREQPPGGGPAAALVAGVRVALASEPDAIAVLPGDAPAAGRGALTLVAALADHSVAVGVDAGRPVATPSARPPPCRWSAAGRASRTRWSRRSVGSAVAYRLTRRRSRSLSNRRRCSTSTPPTPCASTSRVRTYRPRIALSMGDLCAPLADLVYCGCLADSAAADAGHWGLRVETAGVMVGSPEPLCFVTTHPRQVRRQGVRVTRVTRLPAHTARWPSPNIAGWSPLGDLTLLDLVTAGDWLLRERLTTLPALRAYVGSTSIRGAWVPPGKRSGWCGNASTRCARPGCGFALVFAGLPTPQCNPTVQGVRRNGRVDLTYFEYRVLLEYEGVSTGATNGSGIATSTATTTSWVQASP